MVIIKVKKEEWQKIQTGRKFRYHALLAQCAREGKPLPWETNVAIPQNVKIFVTEEESEEKSTRATPEFSPAQLAAVNANGNFEFREFVTANKRDMSDGHEHVSISEAVLWLDKARNNGSSSQQIRNLSHLSKGFKILEEHVDLIEA